MGFDVPTREAAQAFRAIRCWAVFNQNQ